MFMYVIDWLIFFSLVLYHFTILRVCVYGDSHCSVCVCCCCTHWLEVRGQGCVDTLIGWMQSSATLFYLHHDFFRLFSLVFPFFFVSSRCFFFDFYFFTNIAAIFNVTTTATTKKNNNSFVSVSRFSFSTTLSSSLRGLITHVVCGSCFEAVSLQY